MSASVLKREHDPKCDLAQVVEPLASFICAADRPREMLLVVLAVLRQQVAQTNRAARACFSGNRTAALGLV